MGCGYAAGVELWITLKGQGYPQAPHPLGQHYVLPTYPQPLLLQKIIYFSKSETKTLMQLVE